MQKSVTVSRIHRSLFGALLLASLLAVAFRVQAQPRQPFSDEAVAQLIRAALLQYFDPSSVFEISASGSAIAGDVLYVDDISVSGKPLVVRGVRGEVLAFLKDLQLDMAELGNQRLKLRKLGKATVVARSTAKALQKGLARISTTILKPTLKFSGGQFEMAAELKQGDRLYPVLARGRLVVEEKQRVRIALTEVKISGGDLPEGTVEKELAKVNPVLDLAAWPIKLYIQRLTLHNDRIEILATSDK